MHYKHFVNVTYWLMHNMFPKVKRAITCSIKLGDLNIVIDAAIDMGAAITLNL